MLNVTRVIIDSYTPKESGTCAECSIVINNSLMIKKLKVIKGKEGEYFVAMPHTGVMRRADDGKKRFEDIVYPLTPALSKRIKTTVLDKYLSYVKTNDENVDS